jgi:hypothetical protein
MSKILAQIERERERVVVVEARPVLILSKFSIKAPFLTGLF